MSGQVHLDERLLHGRFPAPVALYDGCLERGQAKFRDGDVELSRAREEFPVVVAAAVVPAAFGAFVLLGIAEACRLLVQHRVERVLDRAPDERFQVVLESGFVDFDYISFHRMVLFLCLICGYFKSKNWNILFFYPLNGICERKYTLPILGGRRPFLWRENLPTHPTLLWAYYGRENTRCSVEKTVFFSFFSKIKE